MLLFDLGGTIAAAGMFGMAIMVGARHTAQLYCQEPLHGEGPLHVLDPLHVQEPLP
jgi:hypothetical protein